jgi:crotonobetainyl-CoA:carnitine CoA-transferase CaiB-like acyl-CoA transferase
MKPLDGMRVVSLATNLPGPLAVARMHELGASVIKVEPPDGDPLAYAQPDWYRTLNQGQQILSLNLKTPKQRAQLDSYLERADLLVTSSRPSALKRLGLSWDELILKFPRLCQVAIVGFASPHEEVPGHDLTYQARVGLLSPPEMPRTLLADLAGAQEAVQAALGAILARKRGHGCHYVEVSLAKAAEFYAGPLRHGLTQPGGHLGGGFPGYNLYQTKEGWIAIAALEPHFMASLAKELSLNSPTKADLQNAFRARTAREWEIWGAEHDLPITVV